MAQLLPAIVNTIKASKETIAEFGDTAFGVMDASKVLNDVPVISLAVKALSIRDEFVQARLKRNCLALMRAVADADEQALRNLGTKLESDPNFADDFADTMMSLLIEAQKPIKCEIVGRLVKALARHEIKETEFSKLAEIVHASTIPALKALPQFFNRSVNKPYLSGHGELLEEPLLLSLGVAHRFGNMFRIDISGQNLYRYGFGGTVDNMQ